MGGDAGELGKGSEASQAMKGQEWECQHLTTKEGEEPKDAAAGAPSVSV